MSRRALMPVSVAVLLTLAAGLSLAVEAMGAAPKPPPASSSGSQSQAAPGDSTGASERGAKGKTDAGRPQTKAKPDVGSRALTGRAAQESAADQPEMATGADLKGPPIRFPAADTPE